MQFWGFPVIRFLIWRVLQPSLFWGTACEFIAFVTDSNTSEHSPLSNLTHLKQNKVFVLRAGNQWLGFRIEGYSSSELGYLDLHQEEWSYSRQRSLLPCSWVHLVFMDGCMPLWEFVWVCVCVPKAKQFGVKWGCTCRFFEGTLHATFPHLDNSWLMLTCQFSSQISHLPFIQKYAVYFSAPIPIHTPVLVEGRRYMIY